MNTTFKLKSIVIFMSLQLLSQSIQAEEWKFDSSMLIGNGKNVDVSLFNQGIQLPGTYLVTIYVNDNHVDYRNVTFSLKKNSNNEPYLYPCLTTNALASYGIKTKDYPEINGLQNECADISAIPSASYDFDFENQKLILKIPQISLEMKDKEIAPISTWDDGISALLLNYSANTSQTTTNNSRQRNEKSSFIQINPGANIGPWRLRNQTNWQKQGKGEEKWQNVYTYAERGINALKSRLIIGDRYTPGDIFDSIPFRGVMISSDDSMVPSSERIFSPIIRGIAKTRARVEVRQNGYIVYSEMVPAGPFALADFTSSGSSNGDLEVTVLEDDGEVQFFTVPYQTPAVSLKEGYLKYNLMGGKYRPANSALDANIAQMTMMYGLPWNLTIYGGIQGANFYQSIAAGLGISLGDWGAISLDNTVSRNNKFNHETGGSWRLRYSKDIIATNTTITMTSYQYSSPNYATLSQALNVKGEPDFFEHQNHLRQQRSSMNFMLSQSLGKLGALGLNDSYNTFWNNGRKSNSLGANYSYSFNRGISMNLNWSESVHFGDTNSKYKKDKAVGLWFNIPMSVFSSKYNQTNATYSMVSSSHRNTSQIIGMNGDAFDKQLHWDVRHHRSTYEHSDDDSNSMVQLNWYGTYGQVGGYYDYNSKQRQIGVNLNGGAILHQNGLTIGQTLGETNVLINTPGAAGLSIEAGRGVKTDYRGYAIQGWVNPYHENIVAIDSLNQNNDVDISQTDEKVVPTKGAVVLAKFDTRVGGRALMNIIRTDGEPTPFGSLVTLDEYGGTAGIVGHNGQVYLTGLPDSGHLTVRWAGKQCHTDYNLQRSEKISGMYRIKGVCD